MNARLMRNLNMEGQSFGGFPKLTQRLLILLALFLGVRTVSAQTESILHSFAGGTSDGYYPRSRLIEDSTGNFYGTTQFGGTNNKGAVFELSPGNPWTERILHNFGGPSDGVNPYGGLVMDSSGNLYGATTYGGTHGYGTVYKLSPGSSWTETVLHSFAANPDGYNPYDSAGLLLDARGNLYGTSQGGEFGLGAIFELSPGTPWTITILHSFKGGPDDGENPRGSLIADSSGNLYGTTTNGGTHNLGSVVEYDLSTGTESLLHSFSNTGDGYYPYGKLAFDSKGNLYGTTSEGGAHSDGTVFELSPGTSWTETLLHSFSGGTGDGSFPEGNLVIDASGNLYGTTDVGGAHSGGIVFKLSPGATWTETLLHSFSGGRTDGDQPSYGDLWMDGRGNLWGATEAGGVSNLGTVFEVFP